MSTLTRSIGRIVAPALALAACSAEPAAIPAKYDDVAQILAFSLSSDASGGLHGAFDDAWGLAYGRHPKEFSIDTFGQASVRHGDAIYTYQLTCTNAAGDPMPACDATTDGARVVATWFARDMGANDVGAYDGGFNRMAIWKFQHLQSGAGTVDGVSLLAAQASFGMIGTPVIYKLTGAFDEHYVIDNLAHQVFAADLVGDLTVQRNRERFDIPTTIELDRNADTAAILFDDNLVLRVDLETTFHGE